MPTRGTGVCKGFVFSKLRIKNAPSYQSIGVVNCDLLLYKNAFQFAHIVHFSILCSQLLLSLGRLDALLSRDPLSLPDSIGCSLLGLGLGFRLQGPHHPLQVSTAGSVRWSHQVITKTNKQLTESGVGSCGGEGSALAGGERGGGGSALAGGERGGGDGSALAGGDRGGGSALASSARAAVSSSPMISENALSGEPAVPSSCVQKSGL